MIKSLIMLERQIGNSEFGLRATKRRLGFYWTSAPKEFNPWSFVRLSKNIRIGFNLSLSSREVGFGIEIPDIASEKQSIAGFIKEGFFRDYIEIHFSPPRNFFKDKSISGKRRLLHFCLGEWEGFLDKLNNDSKFHDINEIRGVTFQNMARFAVRHLGFEYWSNGENKFPEIIATKKDLAERLRY